MVKLSLDTNRDPLADLEEARAILDEAIARRTVAEQGLRAQAAVRPSPAAEQRASAPARAQAPPASAQDLLEETALDTPFFKITVSNGDEDDLRVAHASSKPTLNQLLDESESLTEDEIGELLMSAGVEKAKPHASREAKKEKEDEEAYIEIVEFDEDE